MIQKIKGVNILYKLFLVDDEIWVIRGLMKMIPWEELGFEIVYTTTDSISALEKIALLKPDAVITDIRMASLNGLELLEQSLHMGKERPEFILISAYEEFEYAHKALKLGAFDYLIKPLKKAELVQVLEKLKSALDQKKGGKSRELEELLLEYHSEICAKEIWSTDFQDGKFQIFCCARNYFHLNRVIDVFKEQLESSVIFLQDKNFLYYLCAVKEQDLAGFYYKMEKAANEDMAFLGVSELLSAKDPIYTYVQQAQNSSLQFLLETPDILNFYDKQKRLSKKDSVYHMLRTELSLEKGESILSFLKGILDWICKNHYTVQDLIGIGNYICINLNSQEIDYFQQFGLESMTVFMEKYKNAEDYVHDLEDGVRQVFSEIRDSGADAEDIRRYVDMHYTEQISTGDVAQYFHMDQNYISRVFKKKFNKNIKDYITEKKMEKAKWLLENTDLKIYEVSDASGYTDYFYFTRVFRKLTGITPTEWRENQQDKEKK